MKRKRQFVIVGITAIFLAIGVAAYFLRSGVTRANFDRIQNGMTNAEVEKLFAEKGGVIGENRIVWTAGDGSSAFVDFEGGRVIYKRWCVSNESFLDKIRRRLHLP